MKNFAEISEIIKKSETEVYKYTANGLERKSREVIQQWIEDFPHHVRNYSKNSGRLLTITSCYKIVTKE